MKIAIGLENTPDSLELFNDFFKQTTFLSNYELEVFIIQELLEQEKEIKELKKKVEQKMKKENITGEVIIDKGDPVSRILKLIKRRNIDIFVCQYEHSILKTTFFEKLIEEINIPIITLN